jgi:hypothetical protein
MEQDKVLKLTADTWASFLKIKRGLHDDYTNDFRFHIHALQNILYCQKYKIEIDNAYKNKNVFEIDKENLKAVVNKTLNRNNRYNL